MYLEMSLKLLSGDWGSHDVGAMYETVFGNPHPNPDLMAALKAATMNQKYLLSPAEGIIDHVPELEALGDSLYAKLRSKYFKFAVDVDDELPDSFSRFLLNTASRFFKTDPVEVSSEMMDHRQLMEQTIATAQQQLKAIQNNLGTFLANGHKLRIAQFKAGALLG